MKYVTTFILISISLVVKGQDSSIIDDLGSVKVGDEIPMNIAVKYFDVQAGFDDEPLPMDLDYFKECNDTAVIIISRHTGVSSHSNIGIITKRNGHRSFSYSIMDAWDQDGLEAVDESTEYRFINPNLIEIVELTLVVQDSSKFDPVSKKMKNGYFFSDQKMVSFEEFWYIKIEDNCRIYPITPGSEISKDRKFKQASLKLLSENEIKTMSNYELQLMRNEIFADHGYIFRSIELESYFGNESWYNPRYEDVTSMLTELEKLNIETIIKQEKKSQGYK